MQRPFNMALGHVSPAALSSPREGYQTGPAEWAARIAQSLPGTAGLQ
jgi:hypothetical protein